MLMHRLLPSEVVYTQQHNNERASNQPIIFNDYGARVPVLDLADARVWCWRPMFERREARCSHTLTSFYAAGSVHPADSSKASTANSVRRLVSGCTSARAALYPAILLSRLYRSLLNVCVAAAMVTS